MTPRPRCKIKKLKLQRKAESFVCSTHFIFPSFNDKSFVFCYFIQRLDTKFVSVITFAAWAFLQTCYITCIVALTF
jgi:hypothetical protein